MKIRNHFNQSSGFTLVELLVVVSIVAILSVSSVIGFGHLGNTLKAKEAAGFISDIMKQEELKILRGDFDKAVIHFLRDYLVIEEWSTEATTALNLGSDCDASDYEIVFTGSGNLIKKDGEGEALEVRSVDASDPPICVLFMDAKDTEWSYQLISGEQSSATLRFAHFNLQRDSEQKGLWIKESSGSTAEILAPYGRKRYFKFESGSLKSVPGLVFPVGDSEVSESVTLQ